MKQKNFFKDFLIKIPSRNMRRGVCVPHCVGFASLLKLLRTQPYGRGIRFLGIKTLNTAIYVFWPLLLELFMLPYQVYRLFMPRKKPGRPGSHPISKWFKEGFEHKKAKKFIGAGLTVGVMFFGVIGNTLAASDFEVVEEVMIVAPSSKVATERSLKKPVEGIFAQGFHGLHRAIDIVAPLGEEVKPIAGGKIVEVSWGRIGWGNTVVIDHGDGLTSRYAHLDEIRVNLGEVISDNKTLGTIGLTGWTTGSHLHLEILKNNKFIDPELVLPEFEVRY